MPGTSYESLTEKQIEVLDLVLKSMSSKEIARELGISPKSVDKRIDGARIKLGASTRTEAARIYGTARYGEMLPVEAIPLRIEADPDHPLPRTATGGVHADPPRPEPDPTARRGVLGRRPGDFGKIARLMFIPVGALIMCIVILLGLSIVQGFEAIFYR